MTNKLHYLCRLRREEVSRDVCVKQLRQQLLNTEEKLLTIESVSSDKYAVACALTNVLHSPHTTIGLHCLQEPQCPVAGS